MTNSILEESKVIKSFSNGLTLNEIDALKYRLSISATKLLDINGSVRAEYERRFNAILGSLINIQWYRDRVPEYGLAYRGRPAFITDEILENLSVESSILKISSRRNFDQDIYQVDNDNDDVTHAEKFAVSTELHKFVEEHAGSSLKSFVTSYLYYDKQGQYSRPHIDNAFTGITVMLGLEQKNSINKDELSCGYIYWPNKNRLEYRLKPGEISIFFGAAVLHGRTFIKTGESTRSLLISFRPSKD